VLELFDAFGRDPLIVGALPFPQMLSFDFDSGVCLRLRVQFVVRGQPLTVDSEG